MLLNQSVLNELNKQTNSYAYLREYLISFMTEHIISDPNFIKLQASTIVQLTKATNQLTRITSVKHFI